jgi:hypothetical protein
MGRPLDTFRLARGIAVAASCDIPDAIDGREVLGRLQIARRETETDLARTYQRLVEQKTWIEVYKNSPIRLKPRSKLLKCGHAYRTRHGYPCHPVSQGGRKAIQDAYRAVPLGHAALESVETLSLKSASLTL